MRRALMLALALCGCLEVIEHAPAGSCRDDSECECGLDCNVEDGGFKFCAARVTHSCLQSHDCTSHDAGTCLPVVRDGGACGYSVCG